MQMRCFSIFEADGRSDGVSQLFKLPGDGMPSEGLSALTRTVSAGFAENYRTGRLFLNLLLGQDTITYLKKVFWPNVPEAHKSLRWILVSSPRHTKVCPANGGTETRTRLDPCPHGAD